MIIFKKKLGIIITVLLLISCNGENKTSSSSLILSEESSSIDSSLISSIIESSEIESSEVESSSSSSSTVIDLNEYYQLTGFAKDKISNRENAVNESGYVIVKDEIEFILALKEKSTKVIEITSDLNLGFNEVKEKFEQKGLNITDYKGVFLEANKPLTHPILLEKGVGRINIQDRNLSRNNPSLMIYSKNGNVIRRAKFVIKRSEDIVIRNLSFKDLWEWDEKSKGDYDVNDWDYFTIENCDGVYLDHLSFEKSYDGLIDIKEGSKNVTISWSKFEFIETEFIKIQFDYLEENRSLFSNYDSLRDQGIEKEDIMALSIPQKKGHLVGANELKDSNNDLSLTLHHNYYENLQDRLPRLRGGNVHVYNCISDSSYAYTLRKSMENKYGSKLSSKYKLLYPSQALVTTENGAVLMEDCIIKGINEPVRNNQKGSDSRYTGKYLVLNSIYELNGYRFIGGSEDNNTPFYAKQAPIIEFSFNHFESLPYEYSLIDVLDLEALDLKSFVGASDRSFNWLKI